MKAAPTAWINILPQEYIVMVYLLEIGLIGYGLLTLYKINYSPHNKATGYERTDKLIIGLLNIAVSLLFIMLMAFFIN